MRFLNGLLLMALAAAPAPTLGAADYVWRGGNVQPARVSCLACRSAHERQSAHHHKAQRCRFRHGFDCPMI